MVFVIILFFGLNNVNALRINEGASTSSSNADEHCELQDYASRIILLMTAQDVSVDNLTYMMDIRYPELEAFHDEIISIISRVEFGDREPSVDITAEHTWIQVTDYIILADLSIY